MLTALLLALTLAGPIESAEAPASRTAPIFVMLGGFRDEDDLQFGFADMSTYRRTSERIDIWENWLPYRPIASDKGPIAYYRRRFTYDCGARNDTMTEVQAIAADGRVLQSLAFPDAKADRAEPGMVGYSTVAFMCDGRDPDWGYIAFPTWDAAVAGARKMAVDEFGAR